MLKEMMSGARQARRISQTSVAINKLAIQMLKSNNRKGAAQGQRGNYKSSDRGEPSAKRPKR